MNREPELERLMQAWEDRHGRLVEYENERIARLADAADRFCQCVLVAEYLDDAFKVPRKNYIPTKPVLKRCPWLALMWVLVTFALLFLAYKMRPLEGVNGFVLILGVYCSAARAYREYPHDDL